jgi:hypothetical protein
MSLRLCLPEMATGDLITLLADPHRSVRAYERLLTLGPEAAEAARGGLAHPDARVREHCCKVLDHLMDAEGMVGQWVHSHQAARGAITRAAAQDPSPAVRKKASWYAPGGPIYRRTRPRSAPR